MSDFYDDPQRETYYLPSAAFGATTDSVKLIGPKGKKGYVRDVIVILTADAVGTTTVPEIAVGTSQGNADYARFRLGTSATAGVTAANSPHRASQVGGNTLIDGSNNYEDFPGHVKLGTAPIPADTAFFISRVAGTGGVPAGTGSVYVVIDWF